MIKFFRRIRKKLLEENRLSKYLVYAAGEIILVMIGILLALQVSNWNEQKKEIQSQKKLFSNLKIDFQNRLQELEAFKELKNSAIYNIEKLNIIIANRSGEIDEAEVVRLTATLLNNFLFNDESKLLEGVFNTGLINDIKNEKLKRRLIEWPLLVEEMLEEQRLFQDENSYKFEPLLNKYISARRLYQNFHLRNYQLPNGKSVSLKEDYQALLGDRLFENQLARKELLLRISIIDNQNLIDAAREIIELLEEAD